MEGSGREADVDIEAAPGELTRRPAVHPPAGWAEAAAAWDAEGLLDALTSTHVDDELGVW